MNQLEHFSHDHPLIFNEKPRDDEEQYPCYACEEAISGAFYGCRGCLFFLHKSCAELPHAITHYCHPEHPLTLHPNPPSKYKRCICDICLKHCTRFVYCCSLCEFDIDVNCAFLVHNTHEMIEHSCHQHQLIPIQKPATFFCDACGIEHNGSSYLCITCGFWVNQKCASVPSTIKLHYNHHHHSLTLIHSIPTEHYNPDTWQSCKICSELIHRRNWVYGCLGCGYFVHLNCGTSNIQYSNTKIEHQDPSSKQSKDYTKDQAQESSPINLPKLDKNVDLVTQFIKDVTLQGTCREVEEIIAASHEHQLNFFDSQIKYEEFTGNKQELWCKDEQCYGCEQTISTPCYYCPKCYFSLHQWCAELPKQLRHPSHPEHSLMLITQRSTELYVCKLCKFWKDEYVYGCDKCDFYLDGKCATLPRTIKHEVHKHALALRPLQYECDACGLIRGKFGYICDICKYNLCIGCSLFSKTFSHRYDTHPFVLVYGASFLKQVDEEYYCEICEEEINPEYWFYHCHYCNQSLHASCIHPSWWHFDIKDNRISGRILNHPHRVKIVEKPTFNTYCFVCDEYYRDGVGCVYDCESCQSWIHPECIGYTLGQH